MPQQDGLFCGAVQMILKFIIGGKNMRIIRDFLEEKKNLQRENNALCVISKEWYWHIKRKINGIE